MSNMQSLAAWLLRGLVFVFGGLLTLAPLADDPVTSWHAGILAMALAVLAVASRLDQMASDRTG